jgi:hypothetical protein
MNAYKARVIKHGEPNVIDGTLYFERFIPVVVSITLEDGTKKQEKIGERMQRVRALKKNETPPPIPTGDSNESTSISSPA